MVKEESDLLVLVEKQQKEIASLRQAVSDAEIALLTAIEHGDSIEEQLLMSNDALKAEASERLKAEQNLHNLIKALTQQKDDLEMLVETITEHGDDIQYEWLEKLGAAEEEALTDALTSVANRRHFDHYLVSEWNKAVLLNSDFSIIMIDIDHFKLFNDKYGHQAGDACIQKVAEQGNLVCGRPADLFARYGGEEFAIVLPNTKYEGAMNLAMKLRENVEKLNIPHEDSQVCNRVTISVGVASCHVTKECNVDKLLQMADNLLYQAKESGRNKVTGKYNKKVI